MYVHRARDVTMVLPAIAWTHSRLNTERSFSEAEDKTIWDGKGSMGPWAIISYYDIVGFVDGDRSIISEDRQHCYAHAEIRGQETVAEDGFELIVVGSGILDACHRLN